MSSPAKKSSGAFVVLEGIDGAGTTTQTDRLAALLREDGFVVHTTREPSDGPIGLLIRDTLKRKVELPDEAMALMFAADRMHHLRSEVLPAVERGEIVISDRYLLSSLAYQGTLLPMPWVEEINAHALPPDLTLFIDVDAATAARRRSGRGGSPELYEVDELQQRVARQYLVVIKARKGKERILLLDGSRQIDDVTRDAYDALEAFLVSRKGARVRGP